MTHFLFRRLPGASVFAVLLATGLVASAAPQEKQVWLTVLEKDGTPVRDLTAGEFVIAEGALSRPVVNVALASEPLSVLVLIDTTKSPIGTTEPTRDVRLAVQTFVKTVFAGGQSTQMALMDYAGVGTMLRGFTSQVADVEKAAGRIVPSQHVQSVLLETLIDAAKDLGKRPGPRRAIVILDRGAQDNSQVLGPKIVEAVLKSGAAVWVVSLPQTSGRTSPARDYALETFPAATGGVRFTTVSASGLEAMMKKVADALVSQYVVTYSGEGNVASVAFSAKRGSQFLKAPWAQ